MASEIEIADAITSFVNAMNSGNFDEVVRFFSDEPTIVEDLPPYRWTGPSAPSQWLAAMGQNASTLGVTSIVMEIREPTRTDVVGNRAYSVVPGLLRLRNEESELKASGTLTFTLQEKSGEWLFDALVWSGPRPE